MVDTGAPPIRSFALSDKEVNRKARGNGVLPHFSAGRRVALPAAGHSFGGNRGVWYDPVMTNTPHAIRNRKNGLNTNWMKGDYMRLTIAVLATFVFSDVALATTWVPSEETDPLTGEKVPSQEIASYGSYIYGWPSKYDLVFWPLTDENWICMNPKNGYAAFNDDFEKMPDETKKTLTDWLEKNYEPAQQPASHEAKLAWLEKVYAQRKMDADFWCRFYRLMAYVHREDEKTSLTYVKKTLPLLEKKLQSKPEGIAMLEVLYLLGEYHRRLGDAEKAEDFFSQVKNAKYKDKNGKEQVGHPYLTGLVEDRRKLKTDASSNKRKAGDGR